MVFTLVCDVMVYVFSFDHASLPQGICADMPDFYDQNKRLWLYVTYRIYPTNIYIGLILKYRQYKR